MPTFTSFVPLWLSTLAVALATTAIMTIASFLVANILGLVLTVLVHSRFRALRRITDAYIIVFRGVPVLIILYLGYFSLPGIDLVLSALTVAIIGLGLYYAAQMAEVFRSGFIAIAKGQLESAQAVGFTPVQAMRVVILPQLMRLIIPPLIVTFVSTLKDSSLGSLITVPGLMLEGNVLSTESALPLQVYILVGVFYFMFAFPLSMVAKYLERRLRQRNR